MQRNDGKERRSPPTNGPRNDRFAAATERAVQGHRTAIQTSVLPSFPPPPLIVFNFLLIFYFYYIYFPGKPSIHQSCFGFPEFLDSESPPSLSPSSGGSLAWFSFSFIMRKRTPMATDRKRLTQISDSAGSDSSRGT